VSVISVFCYRAVVTAQQVFVEHVSREEQHLLAKLTPKKKK
jgi:hypothetical protein